VFARLHGTIRTEPGGPPQDSAVGGQSPDGAADGQPQDDTVVIVAGIAIGKGSRVRLRPRARGTDAHDMFLAGRHAVVEDVLTDVDGSRFLAVSVEGDPAADLQRMLGRFFHFSPDEVDPAGPP
jgi:hypothetical protein